MADGTFPDVRHHCHNQPVSRYPFLLLGDAQGGLSFNRPIDSCYVAIYKKPTEVSLSRKLAIVEFFDEGLYNGYFLIFG